VAEVRFDDLAAAALERLYGDPAKTQLADRVDAWLDRLEAGDEATTRDEFRSPALGLVYVIVVYGSGEQWAIVWKRHSDELSFVHYLGPAESL
jgi:hypothetical protein